MAGVLEWEQVTIATGGTLSPAPRPSTLASSWPESPCPPLKGEHWAPCRPQPGLPG